MFLDLRGHKMQIKTATWVVSTFLSRFYDAKMSRGHSFSFEELWDLTREDFEIAKKCKGGKWLDPNIFSYLPAYVLNC